MDWMAMIGESWLSSLEWLLGLGAAFSLLAWLAPCNPGMVWWKDLRGFVTDLIYWFFMPFVFRFGRTAMLLAGVVVLYGGNEPGFLPVKQVPIWQQCVAILIVQDVLLYWIHRAFHTRRAWQFHAVHHSPTTLDWMSMTRFHPVNSLLEFAVADVVVVLLGFSPAAVLALSPFNTIYSAMVHANLNWTFGPFRYVFASPVFHRWHHTTREAGLDKNFAATFPILDVIFGTYYMPAGELPSEFGSGEADFPVGFWGQLIHPFESPSRRLETRSVPRPHLPHSKPACKSPVARMRIDQMPVESTDEPVENR
jgi:sterol desaturase/sphingolipid hydroxylase (fatty acid hydroxylase superfamily)